MDELLQLVDVTTGYGQTRVLKGLQLRSDSALSVGLFGPNGHGKTTLLKTVSGLLRLWDGSIVFRGQDISNWHPTRIVQQGLVHVAQGSSLFPAMTVAESLQLGAYLPRARARLKKNLEQVYDLFPRTAERRNHLCKTLSGGERQMVAIGIGLMGNPNMLVLDEPTLGLAPKVKDELQGAILEIKRRGTPLLIVDQDVEFLMSLTETMYMVYEGHVTLKRNSSDGIDRDEIARMYFGSSSSA